MTNAAELIDKTAQELGLSLEAQFVPFSQSRNKDQKDPSLNWKVTLKRNGREIISTDYMQGCADAPSYRQMDNSVKRAQIVREECEAGVRVKKPALRDVLYSLSMDADAIEYPSFEEWASNFGYETDSRKAENIYRTCLEIALKLRAAIGDDGLAKLREACQDY